MHSRALLALLGLLLAMLASPAFSANAELQEISDLISRKQTAQASEKLARLLQSRPQDGQAKLLQGIVLSEQKKNDEAIAVFSGLIKQHPDWPEPYNNLAVLYARQGDLERARQMLEASMRTHPSYAMAHENLSSLYAAMASEAYDKALKTGTAARAQPRLAMIQPELGHRTNIVAMAPRVPEPVAPPAPATKPLPIPASPLPAVSATAPEPVTPVPVAVAKPAEAPPSKPAPLPPSEPPKPALQNDAVPDIEDTIRDWAKAWSRQNVDSYLDFYAGSFQPPKGQSRREWEQMRRTRIKAPKSIEVSTSNFKIEVNGTRAKASFKQNYRADRVARRTSKTLVLQKQGKRWLIVQETAG